MDSIDSELVVACRVQIMAQIQRRFWNTAHYNSNPGSRSEVSAADNLQAAGSVIESVGNLVGAIAGI